MDDKAVLKVARSLIVVDHFTSFHCCLVTIYWSFFTSGNAAAIVGTLPVNQDLAYSIKILILPHDKPVTTPASMILR
jgi:hypothetical protein